MGCFIFISVKNIRTISPSLLNITLNKYSTKQNQSFSKRKWKSVVGLEVHAQIASRSKLFSGASTQFGMPINSCVSLFDAAIPGTLPVLNRHCVEAGVLTALALSCKVNPISMFDRKHYFYSDLPGGYQITQQRLPLAQEGMITFHVYNPGIHKTSYTKVSKIVQLQLEQDSGKSLHDEYDNRSLVDLNRAGLPLMEIVFEPDLSDGEEAAALVSELMLILKCLGTCSCKMEEGNLRVDANVSVHQNENPLGVRTEIKNIGSVRSLSNAIKYEIDRQINVLENNGVIQNETRAWNAETNETVSLRDKEEKQDYRYMPEPNLPPLYLRMENTKTDIYGDNLVNVDILKKKIPELPEEVRCKLTRIHSLSQESAIILVNEEKLLLFFRKIVSENPKRTPKTVSNMLIMQLLGVLNKNKISLEQCCISSVQLGEIIDLLESGTVNVTVARMLIEEIILGNSLSPKEIVHMKNWTQLSDSSKIRTICEDIIKANPELVQKYLSGQSKLFSALMGKVAKSSEQPINMAVVDKELKNLLEKMKCNS